MVEADFEILGDRRDATLEESRQKEPRHKDECHDADDFPDHHAEAVGKGVAVQPDHLFGREVRQ